MKPLRSICVCLGDTRRHLDSYTGHGNEDAWIDCRVSQITGVVVRLLMEGKGEGSVQEDS